MGILTQTLASDISRRHFLISAVLVGGGLAIGLRPSVRGAQRFVRGLRQWMHSPHSGANSVIT